MTVCTVVSRYLKPSTETEYNRDNLGGYIISLKIEKYCNCMLSTMYISFILTLF